MKTVKLAIHAGAGFIIQDPLAADHQQVCRAALTGALTAGWEILNGGGTALDAVERAVRMLEDYEEFNAGRGSVLTAGGDIEMDAAIMDGTGRRAGAVAGVSRLRNPVSAARAVLEHSPHILLVGTGAEEFARAHGAETADCDYFITARRCEQLEQARRGAYVNLDHAQDKYGTVGAVARDANGRLAAATSTGGMINKLPGRIGDSPLLGAGTWADNATCAVSATGHGESFIRTAFAHEVDALLRHRGLGLHAACRQALDEVRKLGYSGGCIAVDTAGNLALPFNTSGMYRGWMDARGRPHVAIFAGEDSGLPSC